MSSFATTTRFLIDSTGNVGIGTTTPQSLLAVSGGASIGADYNTAAPTNGLIVEGRVGIGTTSPQATLTVITNNSVPDIALRGSGVFTYLGYDFTQSVGSPPFLGLYVHNSNSTVGTLSWAVSRSTGNFGVGTTTPLARLDVAGTNGGTTPLLQVSSVSSFATTTRFLIDSTGNVGIGTSSPYANLTVWGSDTASSTLAFNVVNNASTTVFAVFDGGNAQLSGTLTQSSDQRLKTNIQSLDASSSLSLIDALNPVTFNWIDSNQGSGPQVGFIAQQVQPLFPELVSTTSATALTPGGTLGLNYIGLISPIVSAIQALYTDVHSLIAEVQGFAQSFTSNTITATNELCVSNGSADENPVCVTKAQLAALLASQGSGSNQSPSAAQPSPAAATSLPESVTQNSASSTPPTIIINGDNPAIITIGDSYADLGATVSDTGQGQAGDTNLGLKYFLNGALVSNIIIDTSAAATDTIDYVATDNAGNTATSTRTVVVEAATSTAQ